MSIVSFLVGAVVGGIAMKFYMDKKCQEEEAALIEEQIDISEPAHAEAVEITADGTIEIAPSDEELVNTAIKNLKRAKSRISMASVARESGLSTYKVGKFKALIAKHKTK